MTAGTGRGCVVGTENIVYNPNPTVYSLPSSSNRKTGKERRWPRWIDEEDTDEETNEAEPIDSDEVFDLIRSISDPEYPNTLEELRVVSAPQIKIGHNRVTVEFTPTVPHCGMSTLIGLCIRVRLLRSLPDRFKIDIVLKPGSHQSEHAVNKQLNDKERVAAALENPHLLDTLEQCLSTADRDHSTPPPG